MFEQKSVNVTTTVEVEKIGNGRIKSISFLTKLNGNEEHDGYGNDWAFRLANGTAKVIWGFSWQDERPKTCFVYPFGDGVMEVGLETTAEVYLEIAKIVIGLYLHKSPYKVKKIKKPGYVGTSIVLDE